MRPMEILLWLVASIWVAYQLLMAPPRPSFRWVAAALSATALVAQAALEGSRFHLLPAYLLLVAGVGLSWWRPTRRWGRLLLAAPLFLLMLAGAALPSLFPVFHYPRPVGR